MNDTIHQLMARKSVRVFTEKEITKEERQAILLAATAAPTAGNQQLYTVLNITDPALQARLADTCDHQPFIAEAKLVLIFLADCKKWYEAFRVADAEPREPGIGDLLLAVSDANLAAQNAVTAAESLGIGSCYIGDIMENAEEHRMLLGLPPYVFPCAMLVFGYPAESQVLRKKPARLPLSQVVFENRYPALSPDDYRAMFTPRAGAVGYEEYMNRFCRRKYNSDFSREMTRSVALYCRDFLPFKE